MQRVQSNESNTLYIDGPGGVPEFTEGSLFSREYGDEGGPYVYGVPKFL